MAFSSINLFVLIQGIFKTGLPIGGRRRLIQCIHSNAPKHLRAWLVQDLPDFHGREQAGCDQFARLHARRAEQGAGAVAIDGDVFGVGPGAAAAQAGQKAGRACSASSGMHCASVNGPVAVRRRAVRWPPQPRAAPMSSPKVRM